MFRGWFLFIFTKTITKLVYTQQEPRAQLTNCIKSFWMVDSEGDSTIHRQKIIPDGYPELIFHYGAPYRANITGTWHVQAPCLLAGQIRNFFYLENTGVSKIVAIKLQPWALKLLFDVDMDRLNNNVVPVDQELLATLDVVKNIAIDGAMSFSEKVFKIENWFSEFLKTKSIPALKGITATQRIIESRGKASLSDIRDTVPISERSLERFFKAYIGLTPKFYFRIIRFSTIFNLIQQEGFNWSDLTYLAGYYDQSHFIKNFKEFTGEEPSKYGFDEQNMANFFLKK